jgi:bifunctional DNA-binding transcriptional regulator/antitoxin component of YhaV-PrlF toxin-antitoxin module
MAKVTSKLQITMPKALAAELGIRSGDDIDWAIDGRGLRVTPSTGGQQAPGRQTRLRLFDEATERQRHRQQGDKRRPAQRDRGWSREELYDRVRAR